MILSAAVARLRGSNRRGAIGTLEHLVEERLDDVVRKVLRNVNDATGAFNLPSDSPQLSLHNNLLQQRPSAN